MTREGDKIKWMDVFGYENFFMQGRDGDVFHLIPEIKDEEGDSYVRILSSQAIIEMADMLRGKAPINLPGEETTP